MAAGAIGYLAPDFFAIHPIAYDAPEEDVLLLDLSFMSQSPEAMMHVPSYSRWLEDQDHTKCYKYLLTLLKILHWQRPGDCWVLNPREIGAHWMRKILCMMERSMAVRRSAGDGAFVDVSFRDLIADPPGEVRRIYQAAGIGCTSEGEEAAQIVSGRDTKNRRGKHVYSPTSFGLDDEAIDEATDFYRRAFRL